MKISAVFVCILCSIGLSQSEKCFSTYLKNLQGHNLTSTPVERILMEQEILCVMRCINEKWCQAVNYIDNGQLKHCELFNEQQVRSGQVVQDELSVYYEALTNQGIMQLSQDCCNPSAPFSIYHRYFRL